MTFFNSLWEIINYCIPTLISNWISFSLNNDKHPIVLHNHWKYPADPIIHTTFLLEQLMINSCWNEVILGFLIIFRKLKTAQNLQKSVMDIISKSDSSIQKFFLQRFYHILQVLPKRHCISYLCFYAKNQTKIWQFNTWYVRVSYVFLFSIISPYTFPHCYWIGNTMQQLCLLCSTKMKTAIFIAGNFNYSPIIIQPAKLTVTCLLYQIWNFT